MTRRQIERMIRGEQRTLADGELRHIDLTADDGMRVRGSIQRLDLDGADPLAVLKHVASKYTPAAGSWTDGPLNGYVPGRSALLYATP